MRTLVTIVALALTATACGGSTDPVGTGDADGDAGGAAPVGAWELDGAEPAIEVPAGTRVTLTIDTHDGRLQVGGTAACNGYGGTLQLDGAAWTIDQLSWTEMACVEQGVMEAEAAYLEALPTVDAWRRDGDTLTLTGPDVELTFARLAEVEPAELTGTTWEVDGYVTGTGDAAAVSSGTAEVPAARLRLSDDGSFELFTGCRDFAGEWTTSGDEVVFPSWGETPDSRGVDSSGTLTCGDPAEAQERDVLAVVEGGFTTNVDGRRLTMRSGERGLTATAAG